jgi:hypothetical protein
MVLDLNYGSGIPQDIVMQIQNTILAYKDDILHKGGYIGRTLVAQRPNVNPLLRKDIVRKVDMTKANDGISAARISLGGTRPPVVGTKAKDYMWQIYRIDDAIEMNEAEIGLDPSRWNTATQAAMDNCLMRENYTIINGDSTLGITGLTGIADANARGSIVASGGSGTTKDNKGAWDGSETNSVMDPYSDLLAALGKVNPNLVGQLYLGGRPAYMNYLLEEDDLGKMWADKIGPRIFGRPVGDVSWMVKSDYFPADYVYLIMKSSRAAELVIPEDYNVDSNYPRQKGQIQYAEIGGWIGIETHYTDFVVKIDIT